MHPKINALALSLLLVTTPAFADGLKSVGSAAAKSRGNLLALAVQAALLATDAILDEGRKPVRRTDETAEGAEGAGATTHTKTVTSDIGYNLEYIIAGEAFATAEAAHQYAITTLLDKKNYKRTRRSDGLYYDTLNVYMGYLGYNSSVGYFVSDVQAAPKNQQCDNDVCGSLIQFIGSVYYKGTLSEKEVHVSDDYKAKRAAAAAEFAKEFETMTDAELEAIINGVKAQPNAQAQDAEAGANADAKTPSTTTATNTEAKAEAKDDAKADEAIKDKAKPREEQKPFELPEFCSWAKWVCRSDEQTTDTTVAVQDSALKSPGAFDTNYLSFSSQCPRFDTHTITVGAVAVPLQFDLSPLCRFALLVRPAVLAVAYLSALYIVSQAIRG